MLGLGRSLGRWMVSVSLCLMCAWSVWKTVSEVWGARFSGRFQSVERPGFLRDKRLFGVPESALLEKNSCAFGMPCEVYHVVNSPEGGACLLGVMTLQSVNKGTIILRKMGGKNGGKIGVSRIEQLAAARRLPLKIRLLAEGAVRPVSERVSCAHWVGI